MRSRIPAVLFALSLAGLAGSSQAPAAQEPTAAPAQVPRLKAPAITWETLAPYVIAHLVPTMQHGEFTLSLCSADVDRTRVTPWRDELGDFAEVLLLQVMRDHPGLDDTLASHADRFRSGITAMTDTERARYRLIFWDRLLDDGHFTRPLAKAFLKARRAGSLACQPCVDDPEFRPLGIIDDPCRDCPE